MKDQVLLMLLLGAVPLAAQEPQPKPEIKAEEATPALPASEQILDKYVESIGGRTALEKLTSRESKGTFEVPALGSSGTILMLVKAPGKAVMVLDVPKFGVIRQGFDGTNGWDQMPQAGVRDLAGAELEAKKLDLDFYRPLHLKELYPARTVKGRQKVGERDAWLIEAEPASGTVEKWYFDVDNGLLLRQDVQRESPQGSVELQMFFLDYREVDGVKLPFGLRQVLPGMEITIKLDEVKHNVEIDESKFAKPAAQ